MIGVTDAKPLQAQRLVHTLHPPVPVLPLNRLIRKCHLLIEAASPQAVQELLPQAIRQKRPLLILSTGGLLRNAKWIREAIRRKVPIYLPSGALVGLDGIKAAAIGRLRSVTLTTRKPPRALSTAPWVRQRKIRIQRLRRPRLLFQGSALQAASRFPQNINVAATLALAGIGPTRTRVRIIADPRIRTNIHEVEAIGSFGRLFTRTENRASPRNPRTSQLAVQSAVATLRQIVQPLKVGT